MGETLGGTLGDTMGGAFGGTQGSMRDTFAVRSSMRGSLRNRGQGSLKVKNIAGEVHKTNLPYLNFYLNRYIIIVEIKP